MNHADDARLAASHRRLAPPRAMLISERQTRLTTQLYLPSTYRGVVCSNSLFEGEKNYKSPKVDCCSIYTLAFPLF